MYLIFDTETTGLPKRWNAPITDIDNWPRCIQIAWQLHDALGNCIEHQDYLIRPDGFNIPYDAEKIHGISTELASEQGLALAEVLELFNIALSKTTFVVGQNLGFDLNIMGCEFHRLQVASPLSELPVLDTCTEKTAKLCKIPGGRGGRFKLPTLTELHQHLFGKAFSEAHNATADVEATSRIFLELLRKDNLHPEVFDNQQAQTLEIREISTPFKLIGLSHQHLKEASAVLKKDKVDIKKSTLHSGISSDLANAPFVHLHNHSQFSVVQATSRIDQ